MPNRRAFLQAATVSSAAFQLGSAAPQQPGTGALPSTLPAVLLASDGVNLSPAAYLQLLSRLQEAGHAKRDTYLKGGSVEELEIRFATVLGKDKALFFPTGTLANHVAVRLLAGARNLRRVLVQEESHLYRDESDCAQALSGLNLVPLAPGRATIRAEEIVEAVERAAAPPYPSPVGAISIESPVRRADGRAFDFAEMQKISKFARTEKNIGLHLDGARLFLASAYTGVPVRHFSTLFDTVYVSLYKYFNASFGAILAGPQALIDAAAHLRHQFGCGILHGWEPAAVALHYLDGFEDRFRKAAERGEELFSLLERKGIRIHRLDGGTNVFHFDIPTEMQPDPGEFVTRAAARGIILRRPAARSRTGTLQVNETILRRPAADIAEDLVNALRKQ